MSRIYRTPTVLTVPLFVILSCTQSFDPEGSLDNHLVVFTILSTDRSVQFVRVTIPFFSDGLLPPKNITTDNAVTDVTGSISAARYLAFDRNYRGYWADAVDAPLRDTLLARSESDHLAVPLHLYTANPLTLEYGRKYQVYVSSRSHGQAWGSVTIPKKPKLTSPWSTIQLMNTPQVFEPDTPIEFLITLADSLKGYVARFCLDYEVVKDGGWIAERVEIPVSSVDPGTYSLVGLVYPTVTECGATTKVSVGFKNGYLRAVIKNLSDVVYAGSHIVFDRLTLFVVQLDPNLYSYYAMGELDRDPRSIRLDQPPVARLNGGGYGLVGGYTLDSLVYLLPEYFYANNR